MADESLQYLQQVLQDLHALVAHEPDPQLKATYAQCLQALLKAQHQKMEAAQQPGAGAQAAQMLGQG